MRSYRAAAWPSSSWDSELIAMSSSRIGAMPVHSESEKPMTNSSSAIEPEELDEGGQGSARSTATCWTVMLGPSEVGG